MNGEWELEVFGACAFQMADKLSQMFPTKPSLCKEGGKSSMQNLTEPATISLTGRSKGIKWLCSAANTAVSLVLKFEAGLKIKAEQEGGDFPRSLNLIVMLPQPSLWKGQLGHRFCLAETSEGEIILHRLTFVVKYFRKY